MMFLISNHLNMILPVVLTFGLHFTQSLQNQDVDVMDIVIDHHLTGVLGEDIYLQCLYSGTLKISESSWKRLDSRNRAKVMAGYRNGKLFAKDNFSTPASTTNLTVKVSLNSLDLEGNYTCVFSSDEDEIMDRMFLRIIAQPQVKTYVEEDVLNGIYYQNVYCLASYAKPSASLHWDINGASPSENIFSIYNATSILPNATVSIISILRFPIHLNNESIVACVIQHQALNEPSITIVKLQTFVYPNVTIEVGLIEKEEDAFFEVLCKAKGGKPHPFIIWLQPESEDMSCSANVTTFDIVSSSHCFSLHSSEGKNITCIFGYPNYTATERTVMLPTYYFTSLQLVNNSNKVNYLNTSNLLILEEEDRDIRIIMEVLGNFPRYRINCTKDGKPLLEDVNVVVNSLMIKGPVGANHAGQYQCKVFYYRHTATLKFEIKVKLRIQLPVPIHVALFTNTTWMNGIEYTDIKCVADNVLPGANITWDTKECKGGISESKSVIVVSGGQDEHSMVWNIARLPVYFYSGCTIICLVHHAGLKTPSQKSIQIPLIGPPRNYMKVGLQKDTTHWAAVCEYKSDGAVANISWLISDNRAATPLTTNITKEGNKVRVICIYKFNLCQHEGKSLTCVIQNDYGEVKRRTINVPNIFISSIEVLNKSVLLHRSHGHLTDVHSVALKQHTSNQRITFKVNGNVSQCNINCFRSNGLSAYTDGMALVFAQQVSENDAGLYTCRASWYNHSTAVTVLVEVTSQEIHNMVLILICLSSASAITLILMVVLCIFCKKNDEAYTSVQDWKKRESLSALVQEQYSPELKKSKGQRQEYAELRQYSIVIDMKSTV